MRDVFEVSFHPVLGRVIVYADIDDEADSMASSRMFGSLTSSVCRRKEEFGFSYHSYGMVDYMLPISSDWLELEDLLHHAIFLLMGNKLLMGKVPQPGETVVDVGTGTGIWAIDRKQLSSLSLFHVQVVQYRMSKELAAEANLYRHTNLLFFCHHIVADENLWAKVKGFDISPIQPTWVPRNATFYVEDVSPLITEVFGRPDWWCSIFHARNLALAITEWDSFLAWINRYGICSHLRASSKQQRILLSPANIQI
jgi:hypothetical protein